MFPQIRNVLRHLRQEIQRIKVPEIELGPGQQIPAGGFRETSQPVVPSLVDDPAPGGDFNHPRLAERTPQEIFDQPLEALGVFCHHAHALAEPGVFPTPDVSQSSFHIFAFGMADLSDRQPPNSSA